MRIALASGHPKNWDAGASTVFLHLEKFLGELGQDVSAFHQEDYLAGGHDGFNKIVVANRLADNLFEKVRSADVVEVAGNIGWKLFQKLKTLPQDSRPLCVTRLHGLEFKDEHARITEEIAQLVPLSRKYRMFTRHWLNWQEFATIRESDRVLCHSSREADAIVVANLKSEDKVHQVPLGVDREYILPREYNRSGNKLLWWGSWVERKGITALPRAFELALRQRPSLTLTLGGTGWKKEALLEKFAPEVRSRVEVLPFVSRQEHQNLILSHDIFLFPSLSEGFGLALLEVMASGMPAITTFTGMAHDWLEHNRNCVLIPMNAPTTLAREIVALGDDVARRQHIGENARETARELSWERCAKETVEIYQAILKK